MTEEDFREFVAAGRWTFAKTLPWHPHEYTISGRTHSATRKTFQEVYDWIVEAGYLAWFYQTPIYYYDLDGWCFWRGAHPPRGVETAWLLNRARLPNLAERRDSSAWLLQEEFDLD